MLLIGVAGQYTDTSKPHNFKFTLLNLPLLFIKVTVAVMNLNRKSSQKYKSICLSYSVGQLELVSFLPVTVGAMGVALTLTLPITAESCSWTLGRSVNSDTDRA